MNENSGRAPDDAGTDDDEVDDGADDTEGLAEAVASPEAEPRLGHSPADSNTSDEPDTDVVNDPADVDYVELTKIHNVRDLHEARLIKGILESFHIPCVVEGDVSDTLVGVIPAYLDGIDIFVPGDYAQKAKDVLCERNIVCGIDPGRLADLLGERMDGALAGEAAARAEVLRVLSEETKDYRHEALVRIGKRGRPGHDLVRALLRDAVHAETESPLVEDIPTLADHGHLEKNANLLLVDDLDELATEKDPKIRKRVARALGRLRGAGAGTVLVSLLRDEHPDVRDEALEALFALSGGESFGFDPELPPSGQEEAIAAWRAWLLENPAA